MQLEKANSQLKANNADLKDKIDKMRKEIEVLETKN